MINRIKKLSDDLDNEIINAGIVISRYGRKSNYREQTIETLRQNFDNVLDTIITERTDVMEATGKNISIFQTRNSEAIDDFTAVGDAILESVGLS